MKIKLPSLLPLKLRVTAPPLAVPSKPVALSGLTARTPSHTVRDALEAWRRSEHVAPAAPRRERRKRDGIIGERAFSARQLAWLKDEVRRLL